MRVEAHLKSVFLDRTITRLAACDGAHRSAIELVKDYGHIGSLELARQAKGLFGSLVSHYWIYQQECHQLDDDRWILILEDDVVFHPSLIKRPQRLQEYFESLPADAEFVRLTASHVSSTPTNVTQLNKYVFVPNSPQQYLSGAAYAVRPRLLPRLLKLFPTSLGIDVFHSEILSKITTLYHFNSVQPSPAKFYLEHRRDMSVDVHYIGLCSCLSECLISETIGLHPHNRYTYGLQLLRTNKHEEAYRVLSGVDPQQLPVVLRTALQQHLTRLSAASNQETEPIVPKCEAQKET